MSSEKPSRAVCSVCGFIERKTCICDVWRALADGNESNPDFIPSPVRPSGLTIVFQHNLEAQQFTNSIRLLRLATDADRLLLIKTKKPTAGTWTVVYFNIRWSFITSSTCKWRTNRGGQHTLDELFSIDDLPEYYLWERQHTTKRTEYFPTVFDFLHRASQSGLPIYVLYPSDTSTSLTDISSSIPSAELRPQRPTDVQFEFQNRLYGDRVMNNTVDETSHQLNYILIMIDGTWQHAKEMMQRLIPSLTSMSISFTHVHLPESLQLSDFGVTSEQELLPRREPQPGALKATNNFLIS